eukprot:m51a1_g5650 putative protein kinase domain containing protein (697) ;mRNA; f:864356-866826
MCAAPHTAAARTTYEWRLSVRSRVVASRVQASVLGCGPSGRGLASQLALSGCIVRVSDSTVSNPRAEMLWDMEEGSSGLVDPREVVDALAQVRVYRSLAHAVVAPARLVFVCPPSMPSLDPHAHCSTALEALVRAPSDAVVVVCASDVGAAGECAERVLAGLGDDARAGLAERVLGACFRDPIYGVAGVDLVRTALTSEDVLLDAMCFFQNLGKHAEVYGKPPASPRRRPRSALVGPTGPPAAPISKSEGVPRQGGPDTGGGGGREAAARHSDTTLLRVPGAGNGEGHTKPDRQLSAESCRKQEASAQLITQSPSSDAAPAPACPKKGEQGSGPKDGIEQFLAGLGLEKYAETFEKEEVTVNEISLLTEETLIRMGLPMGPRLRILAKIKDMPVDDSPLTGAAESDGDTLLNVIPGDYIGSGAFGRVMKGVWGGVTEVAMKSVDLSGAGQAAESQLMSEAGILRSLRHPNVIAFYGLARHNGSLFMVTELADGSVLSLLRSAKDRPLPDIALVHMAASCAAGMAYLSSRAIVHRDLAARNLLYLRGAGQETYTVKVADFGLACSCKPGRARGNVSTTAPVRWTAPEALASHVFTSQSDMWSFGVVLWELFSGGADPYQGMTNEDVLAKVQQVATLMKSCWASVESRPTFVAVCQTLGSVIAQPDSKQNTSAISADQTSPSAGAYYAYQSFSVKYSK